MRLSLVGVNHQTAPVAIREKVAISTERLGEALSRLRAYMPHGVILSTCNRTEIYTIDNGSVDDGNASLDFLTARLNGPDDKLRRHVYVSTGAAAVEHLFRVASGLESMIVGEFEVLGQVKQALAAAEKAGMVNLPLRQAFHSAIRAGRHVREATGISKNALSVSSVAVDLAAGVVGDLKKCKMLVIGAGEAGRLVAKVARDRGTSRIVIASRTKDRAQALAATFNGIPTDLSNLAGELGRANIVVACAGAPHRILGVRQVEAAMKERPGLPLVIIDIALPRNVAPEVGQIANVFLYNIDALTEISNSNRKQREGAIQQAEGIIMSEVDKFAAWWRDFEVKPVLGALMSKAEEIRAAQLNKTLKKLPPLSDEQRQCLEAMTRSIVTRLLQDPIQYIKTNGNGNHSEMLKEIFQLDTEARG
ncbi:MAG: glutamyl-tRNA reductase [Chloroflexota bacterium]|nr:glutamyl-tRNA reductase [Chloroflexota bacterium]